MTIAAFPLTTRVALSALMLGGLVACTAPNPPPAPPLPSSGTSTALTTADVAFLQQVDELDLKQITIAKLAAAHSNNDTVKAFAGTIEADHTTNRAAIAKIASGSNLTVTTKLDRADQADVDAFSHLYGSAFDRVFLREIVSGHGAALQNALAREAASGGTADIKTLASDTEKMEAAHVGRARDLLGERTIRGHHHVHGRHQ